MLIFTRQRERRLVDELLQRERAQSAVRMELAQALRQSQAEKSQLLGEYIGLRRAFDSVWTNVVADLSRNSN
jgi:hypothetical protein